MSSPLQIIVLLMALSLYADAMHRMNRTPSNKRRFSAPAKADQAHETAKLDETLAKKVKSPGNPNLHQQKGAINEKKFFGKTIEAPATPSDVSGVTTELGDDAMDDDSEVMSAMPSVAVPTNGADEETMVPEKEMPANAVDEPNMVPETGGVDVPMMPDEETEEGMAQENDVHETMAQQNAVAVVDPKSLHAELLEMSGTLTWEMATRSQDSQVVDKKGELSWFPALIFKRLELFVQNAQPASDHQNTEAISQLIGMVDQWKREEKVEPIDVDQQVVQIFEIQGSLHELDEQLTNENLRGEVKATPAVLDIVFDAMENDAHEQEVLKFRWKMCQRKPTRYVKSVGLFFGGISLAMAYLGQAAKVGQWAAEMHFLDQQQLDKLTHVVQANLAKLNDIQREVATKMGINLAEIGISDLLARQVPSMDSLFMSDLANHLANIKETAELEEVQFSEQQIGTLLVLIALNKTIEKVEELEAPIVGTQLTWPLFLAVGQVSEAAQVLNRMQI